MENRAVAALPVVSLLSRPQLAISHQTCRVMRRIRTYVLIDRLLATPVRGAQLLAREMCQFRDFKHQQKFSQRINAIENGLRKWAGNTSRRGRDKFNSYTWKFEEVNDQKRKFNREEWLLRCRAKVFLILPLSPPPSPPPQREPFSMLRPWL
jgi:hypothetical protein